MFDYEFMYNNLYETVKVFLEAEENYLPDVGKPNHNNYVMARRNLELIVGYTSKVERIGNIDSGSLVPIAEVADENI